MICDLCGGSRYLPIMRIDEKGQPFVTGQIPCPGCNGCGLQHCCEGDQATPEAEASVEPPKSAL